MWAATDSGLYEADAPYRRFERVDGLPHTHFWAVTESSSAEIWAGGASGLFRLAGGAWQRFTKRDGLSRDVVVALHAGPDGTIWTGFRFSAEIDHVKVTNGRLSVTHDLRLARSGAGIVYFFGTDARGRVWTGTDRGVDVFDGGRWVHMDSNDGLVWNDCDVNGFAAAPDGSVWTGMSNGLVRLLSDGRLSPEASPSVVFTRLTLDGKDVAPCDQPTVNYRSNDLIVQYSALDFAHGDSFSYRYRLLPLFTDWRSTGRRELEFPGLPPGKYQLEVRARDPWTASSAPAADFNFEVRTPWFRSWWFRGLCALVALGLIGLLVRVRTAALKRREAALMRLVEKRTADLKTANAELYRLSSIDDLTGIANRRACDEPLKSEWARMKRSGEPLSALMLDVDYFKMLNDAEGHQRGDEYLIRLADELRRSGGCGTLRGDGPRLDA